MDRIVVLGRGGSGKSTLARQLASAIGAPLVELEEVFWQAGLQPLDPAQWAERQEELVREAVWVLDGDLGPYDVLAPRLGAADAVVLLDLPLWLCVMRTLRRGRERWDYWRWVITYRRQYLPAIQADVQEAGKEHVFHLIRSRRQAREFLGAVRGPA